MKTSTLLKFIGQKILYLLPTLFGITFLSFVLIRLVPGDPILTILGERGADPQLYQKMQQTLGLDRSLGEQYFLFLKNALSGNLGHSIMSKQSVLSEFTSRFPATLELGIVAMIFATVIGIPLGIFAAVKRNSLWDYLVMTTSLVGYSMPIFWWGIILILFFSVQLGLTPVSGRISVLFDIEPVTGFMLIDTLLSNDQEKWAAWWSALRHLILPAVVLGTIPLASITRMTRSSMLEVLREDYIRTAKAKGLSTFRILGIHALRNAMIPVITVIGLSFGSIITGAILTETIFSWPGIGKWMVTSVSSRDYPVIQGGILLIALLVIATNMIVDLTYYLTNPKMRSQRSSGSTNGTTK